MTTSAAGTRLDWDDHAEAQQLAPEQVTVTLPAGEPLLTSNQRHHWQAKARLTKALRTTTAWIAKAQGVGPVDGPVRITAVIHPKTARRFDPHNYQPSVKAAIDGLVDAGVFPDDDSKVVHAVTFEAGPKNPDGWTIRLVIEAVA